MMIPLSFNVIKALNGRTLVTAESCTGGGIGAELTAVPGSSAVYKGGIISYTNEVKTKMLGVDPEILQTEGAVSEKVAIAMAEGVRKVLSADISVSVTGLAGPSGDEFNNPIGTVFIGYSDVERTVCERYLFIGSRNAVRQQAIDAALQMILKFNQ